jgi:hypothetical protein
MSKYKVPEGAEPRKIGNIQARARVYCADVYYDCRVNCTQCLFDDNNWTPEREAAFLEWESNQNNKGE